jgi:hypothetical protein
VLVVVDVQPTLKIQIKAQETIKMVSLVIDNIILSFLWFTIRKLATTGKYFNGIGQHTQAFPLHNYIQKTPWFPLFLSFCCFFLATSRLTALKQTVDFISSILPKPY